MRKETWPLSLGPLKDTEPHGLSEQIVWELVVYDFSPCRVGLETAFPWNKNKVAIFTVQRILPAARHFSYLSSVPSFLPQMYTKGRLCTECCAKKWWYKDKSACCLPSGNFQFHRNPMCRHLRETRVSKGVLYVALICCWFFFFWLSYAASRILVPWPGIEPGPPAVDMQSPNHWTAKEIPSKSVLHSRGITHFYLKKESKRFLRNGNP